ncbi:MAG TPA: nuclear transport factor 2 family protein [Chitinophagaceae bacterium]|jgi:predicted SnoaL-like aldol condensation-catalyzing enzyme
MTPGNSNKSLKEAAMDFLRLASAGDVCKAYELYIAHDFKHHNPYFKGDRNSLMKGMEDAAKLNPNKEFKMLHALQDGNFVAVHSRVIQASLQIPISVVHIFRFAENRIVELWDNIMPQPEEMVNENGLF